MERSEQSERFTIADQARVPMKPVKPKRMLLFAAAIMAALAFATGLALHLKSMTMRSWGNGNCRRRLGSWPHTKHGEFCEGLDWNAGHEGAQLMYEAFFGLTRSPFRMTPDPGALFLTMAHREALAGLSYAIMERKGFVLLVGEAGTGKTTLLRRLVEVARETNAQTCMVLNPTLTPAEFLELLLHNFGIKDFPVSKARRLLLLEELLTEAHRAGKAPVL